MNIQIWKQELSIFEEDSVMKADDNSIVDIWDCKKGEIYMNLNDDYELVKEEMTKEEEDYFGKPSYVIRKKKK